MKEKITYRIVSNMDETENRKHLEQVIEQILRDKYK